MNPHYKEPVLVFGLIVPSFLVLVVLGLGFHLRGKFETTYKVRKNHYAEYKQVEAQREALAKKISAQEPHMNRWMALFQKATGTDVKGFLSDFQKQYDSQEFAQTAFRRTSSSGGIGGASSQPSIQIQLAFRGTYRALQNAFLELETRMPQLQLDSIKLTVSSQNSGVLTADLIYTAWQKE
jgi:hypothetical protein